MKTWVVPLGLTAWAAMVGGFLGMVLGALVGSTRSGAGLEARYEPQIPLPHHVPEHVGGASFRFAMVQDVIHERFPKHGPRFYQERDRLARLKLADLPIGDPGRFPLMDDIGVGLDRLGKPGEAEEILRRKLDEQLQAKLSGRDLYTSYADLGTFLIHGSFKRAMAGDEQARARFREGAEFIHKSVAVNPNAHFGRERWQEAIVEFLLASMENPELLRKFDCLGNRLDPSVTGFSNPRAISNGSGASTSQEYYPDVAVHRFPELNQPGIDPGSPDVWPKLRGARDWVSRIGAEEGWAAVPVKAHRSPVPFDEPILGIIGMWRQGGGANPHFALALGETMFRVGQDHLAWSAYERAYRMAEKFWPDPETQQFLRDYCRKRQSAIENGIVQSFMRQPSGSDDRGRDSPAKFDSPDNLRAAFDAELAHGQDFQREYQRYEASKIDAGRSINDEHFFDEFYAGREPIASPVGPEEWLWDKDTVKSRARLNRFIQSCAAFGAGLAAFVTGFGLWLHRGRVAGHPRVEAKAPEIAPISCAGIEWLK
ncbi:hypothetical protein [Singulisphaera sp. PoT]|uniref:hypothetical protein n=1 Tax=Singulisphaera sp. PoT TaxID=3411797 RepID=UPI003BF58C8F